MTATIHELPVTNPPATPSWTHLPAHLVAIGVTPGNLPPVFGEWPLTELDAIRAAMELPGVAAVLEASRA